MAATDSRTRVLDAADEAAHIAKARAGDTRALRELLHHYTPGIYRVAHALTQEVRAAVMLCSEAGDRARDEIRQISDDQPFFEWIARILGEQARARRESDPSAAEDPAPPPTDAGEVCEQLRRGFARLDPNEQLGLALRVAEELPYARIAGVLHATSNSALHLVASARGRLLEHLERGERAV